MSARHSFCVLLKGIWVASLTASVPFVWAFALLSVGSSIPFQKRKKVAAFGKYYECGGTRLEDAGV